MTQRRLGTWTVGRVWHPGRLLSCSIVSVAAGCAAVGLIGCGGGDSTATSTTSNEDIAAFIEKNPEFGDSDATAGQDPKSSKSTALGLER